MNAYDIIKMLFNEPERGISQFVSNKSMLEFKTKIGETPLHYFVIENKIELVKKLIQIGANVNTTEMSGETPLLHSIKLKYYEMALLLLDNGADVDIKNSNGETVLSEIVLRGDQQIFVKVYNKCKLPIQYYFSNLDAAEIYNNGRGELRQLVLKKGLLNPYDQN